MFERNIADDQKSVEADPSELDGLPPDYIARHQARPRRESPHHYRIIPMPFRCCLLQERCAAPSHVLWLLTTRAYPKNQDVLMPAF
jgi:hypothetical protein